jgi:hypothetical protein
MAKIKIFSKLLSNINDFKKFIISSIKDRITSSLFSNVSATEETIKNIVIENIRRQPEYSSLKFGELRGMLGIANAGDVDTILTELEDMKIKIKKPSASAKGIDARIEINMVRDGFAQLLSSPAASFVSEKGYPVDWLQWLLLRGNDSVVIGYRYSPEVSPFSRTGQGIMEKGNSFIFRVPPDYAGTVDNNWITRGIDDALPEIEAYMNKLAETVL